MSCIDLHCINGSPFDRKRNNRVIDGAEAMAFNG